MSYKKTPGYVIFDDYYSFKFLKDSNKASRLLSYLATGGAIISACRGENEKIPGKNLALTKQLESDLSNLHYGFRPSIGGFEEEYDDGSRADKTELSFIVPKPKDIDEIDFLNNLLDLARKYKQESILVVLPSINNGNPAYLSTNKEIDMDFDAVKFQKSIEEEPYYTKLKKGPTPAFVFYKKDSNNNLYRFIGHNNMTKDSLCNFYGNARIHSKTFGLTKNIFYNKFDLKTGSLTHDSFPRFKK